MSEHPSESCSVIDESENGMMNTSRISNEEEKIDKENSSLNSNHNKKKK